MPGETAAAILTGRQTERRFVLLTAVRWLPVGITFGLTVLLPLSRGLSLTQVGVLLSIQGFVALALELPAGGLADTLGRRPTLLAAGAMAIISSALILSAQTFLIFALGMITQGLFRVLDSGPLEAWFVDSAHAFDRAYPVERGLSRASTALGTSIAIGALIGGGLVAWLPFTAWSALALPFAVAIVLYIAYSVMLAVLVHEQRGSTIAGQNRLTITDALKRTPGTVALGVKLLRQSHVLRALVLVEVFWCIAMLAFETLTPVQLAHELGSEEAAAALFGPVSAAAWGLFAMGATLAGTLSKRFGVARTATAARLLNGVFVIVMGIALGPAGLMIGYSLAYLTHGSAGPMHSALLHREATSENRSVVLALNSMVMGGAYSLGLLLLMPLAEVTSPGIALIASGAFSLIGALFYLPSRRSERSAAADELDNGNG